LTALSFLRDTRTAQIAADATHDYVDNRWSLGDFAHEHRIRSYCYSRAVLMGSASLMALVAYSTANAQQAPATPPAASQPGSAQNSSDQLTEVIITGYRASLQTALDDKRKSDLPIESVAPEDIGKMPDRTSPSRCSACLACRSIAVRLVRAPRCSSTACGRTSRLSTAMCS